MSEPTLAEIIGDPQRLDAELQKFRKDTKLLSSKRMNFIAKYPKRWIAIYDGQVRADARSLKQILTKVDELQLPREGVVIRYVDRNLRRMIL
jgi:hypothetical protein